MLAKNVFTKIVDLGKNLFSDNNMEVFYIVEGADWSIKWDGKYITKNLNKQELIKSATRTLPYFLRNKIIHFGSIGTFISKEKLKKVHSSNRIVLTWFHVAPSDKRLKYIPELNKRVDIIHTSCEITKKELIKNGLDEDKIVVIPLGVDLDIFKVKSDKEKKEFKEKIDLPDDKIIIGSFQKDGDGWGEGHSPKLIKGPDVFCDVVEEISRKQDVHVLLTGPARGYVKKCLENMGVSYTHKFLDNYLDIVNYYNALDLYLVTSRAEGGPKAVLECMACGVPFVSTKVGMVPDLLKKGYNSTVCDTDDIKCIIERAMNVIEEETLGRKITEDGLSIVPEYNWTEIAKKYYELIYKPLLKDES